MSMTLCCTSQLNHNEAKPLLLQRPLAWRPSRHTAHQVTRTCRQFQRQRRRRLHPHVWLVKVPLLALGQWPAWGVLLL